MVRRALLFPGQGAQEVKMGSEFFERFEGSRRILEEADDVLGERLSALILEGPLELLTRTDNAQAAIFVTSVASIVGAEEAGTFDRSTIHGAAGLSLGEYTALWYAGTFSFLDGLRLVKKRGCAMQEASNRVKSGMVSLLGADRELAENVCERARGDGVLVVANLNAPGQIVLSGDEGACARVPACAKELGVRRAIPLTVAGAFHSPLMEPARAALTEALAETRLADPKVPVYSNVLARPVTSATEVAELLAAQVVSPVRWEDSIRAMIADGFGEFVEPPPGRVLSGLLKKIDANVSALALTV